MLTNEDLKTILAIIDTCAKSGIFRPVDFVVVGDLYNKLLQEIQQNKKE